MRSTHVRFCHVRVRGTSAAAYGDPTGIQDLRALHIKYWGPVGYRIMGLHV